jgi:hypothetical protein
MSLTLDPEVAQALAPMAAPAADQTPPPVGDVLTRRTVQDHILAEVCEALPMRDDITMTDYHATAPDAHRSRCVGTPRRAGHRARQCCTRTAAA